MHINTARLNKYIFTLSLIVTTTSICANDLSKKSDVISIQEILKSKIQTVINACVYIADYDTIKRSFVGPRFSGVVVDKSGLILTAGHASFPGKTYLVQFPNDTNQYIAIGVGRIALYDAAMIKIKSEQEFPVAEIGWSSSLNINDLCFSISYPGSFNPKLSVIRFGYVAELESNKRKMIRTTCLMEPGDSGGPVFDLYGRVIGIRSNILSRLEDNFDVPIDIYRSYWTALLKKEDYQYLPSIDFFNKDSLSKRNNFSIDPDNLIEIIPNSKSYFKKFCVSIVDKSDSLRAIGTLINLNSFILKKKALRNRSFILTKSSILVDSVYVKKGSQRIIAEVIYKDKQSDLALLVIKGKISGSSIINSGKTDSLISSDLGDFLISPLPDSNDKLSVLGSLEFDLPGIFSNGYLGISLEEIGPRKIVRIVQPNSPAKIAGIQKDDEIISINDSKIESSVMFTREVQKFSPEETINLKFVRAGRDSTIKIILGKRPTPPTTSIADNYIGGRSEKRDGFNYAFVHDGKITPRQCGGPVFDINGNFRGVNIARYSRTSNIAISFQEVQKFIDNAVLYIGKSF